MNMYVKIGSVVFGMIALAVSTAFSHVGGASFRTAAWDGGDTGYHRRLP
ncbi:hypothetical protein GVN20_23345 [Runella sp. CRIBMP]|nr:hypothetical protein [Runella sp. CRIBMP]NBB22310.1 hypothetical protein [Runella sp. CRIBMP]